MNRPVEPSHQSYYDPYQMRTVPIRSIVGQTQFYLSGVLARRRAPEENLLLCRYANTIDESCRQFELRQPGIKRVDQTFTAPHFYKADGQQGFEIADEEYRFLIQQRTAEPRQDIQMGGMSL